jgi:hypothetical protein
MALVGINWLPHGPPETVLPAQAGEVRHRTDLLHVSGQDARSR